MTSALTRDADWDEQLRRFTNVHLMQTSAWACFKGHFGWSAKRVANDEAAAQVLFKQAPLGYTVAYLPKGPLGSQWQSLWPEVDHLCRAKKAIFLQVEPDIAEPLPPAMEPDWLPGFQPEAHSIQPRRSIVIDLTQSEDDLLAAMKQKTRYNIRLAERKGVTVAPSQNLRGFHALMHTTGVRDGFALHSFDYYAQVFAAFKPLGQCVLLEARAEDQALAYLMLFLFQERAWYFYGASDNASRNLMPTYLLQWEAMRWAKAHGAKLYDLWGIPDFDEAELEAQFTERSDGLWGVYRFKRGFGGEIVRNAPAYIKVYKPLLYQAYTLWRKFRQAGDDAAS